MTFVLLFVRLALGIVFLMSAIPKIAAPRQFAGDVQQYNILPRPIGSAFAYLLPYVELAASLLLVTGTYPRWAALVVAGLLISFMIAVGLAMASKLNVNCNCFGLLYRERVGWSTQIRDGVLLAMALFIVAADTGELSLANMLAEPGRIGYAIGSALTLIVLALGLVVAFLSIRLARRERGEGHST